VPLPLPEAFHAADSLAADISGKQRTEPVPPQADGLVADVDPALGQQVFDVPQTQRESLIHHHDEADDLG
jgi:hypothetical protein